MSNRTLTESESKKANNFLDKIRSRLQVLSAGDPELLFAYRRKIQIRLMHDERGSPTHRKRLKQKKMAEQKGKCALCRKKLPESGSELDRIKASAGYTVANTRLVHHDCHIADQKKRNFT